MSKQERRRVRVAASLGLTVLMSSAILGGVAPLTANAAEVGSEPTTTEVSPLITAPENPSDAVAGLPEIDNAVVGETTVNDPEQAEEGMASTPDQVTVAEDPLEEKPAENPGGEVQEGKEKVSGANTSNPEQVVEDEALGGQWGDVDWTFENGVLSLGGGTGANTNDVSPWQEIASKVTKVEVLDHITAPYNMSFLFYGFTSVTEFVGLENIDTGQVDSMRRTFAQTRSLTSLDLNSWNVSQLTSVQELFTESGIVSLDLSDWQTDRLESSLQMFSSMPALEYVDISNLVFARKAFLFGNTPSLRTLVLGDDTLLDEVPTENGAWWYGENTGHGFARSYAGGNGDVYHLETAPTEGMWGSVSWRVENEVLYLSEGEGVSTKGASPWAGLAPEIRLVVIEGPILAPENCSALFADFYNVAEFENIEKLNVAKTTDMSYMFARNSHLRGLKASDWDTSSVTNMSYMFWFYGSNFTLELSSWDTSNVTDMSHMFDYNSYTDGHDLSNWDTSSVTDMSYMFMNNRAVQTYDLSNWDTSQVNNMEYMFNNNVKVTSLDLSSWDTGKVTNMNAMFNNCSSLDQIGFENWNVESLDTMVFFMQRTSLESLDLSKWQFSGSTAEGAFAYMPKLQSIDISGFDLVEGNSTLMMTNLPSLQEITLGERSTIRRALDVVPGKIWQGDITGHQFDQAYSGGHPDTYRMTDGVMSYYQISLNDAKNGKYLGLRVLYGQPGAVISLSQMILPAGYELPDPDAILQLPESGSDWRWLTLNLNRVVTTTTRTIEFQGLPEGHQTHEIQEIKWHWDRRQQETDSQNRSLRYYEDVVHLPQGGYDELIVPQVEGYESDIEVVPAKTFDGEITVLPADETFTVTYTKVDTEDGGDQNPDPTPSQPDPDNGSGSGGSNGNGNTGNGSTGTGSTGTGSTGTGSVGGGQLTNLSTGGSSTTDQNQALPQTGSQVASGLTLLGLGLLGLLGFTKRRKSD